MNKEYYKNLIYKSAGDDMLSQDEIDQLLGIKHDTVKPDKINVDQLKLNKNTGLAEPHNGPLVENAVNTTRGMNKYLKRGLIGAGAVGAGLGIGYGINKLRKRNKEATEYYKDLIYKNASKAEMIGGVLGGGALLGGAGYLSAKQKQKQGNQLDNYLKLKISQNPNLTNREKESELAKLQEMKSEYDSKNSPVKLTAGSAAIGGAAGGAGALGAMGLRALSKKFLKK